MSDNKEETTVAKADEVTSVYFDDYHDGVSGADLADEGQPSIFKLKHDKGYFFPIDDEDETHDELFVVIVNCRINYRKFKNNQVVCESDNGKVGFDSELSVERSCERPVEGVEGGCQYSYDIPKSQYPGQGQCGLGMSIQGLGLLDDQISPLQMNMAGSSARSFSRYLKKLKRKKVSLRTVLTRVSAKLIRTADNEWYAGEFKHVEGPLDESMVKAVADVVAAQTAQVKSAEAPAQLEGSADKSTE